MFRQKACFLSLLFTWPRNRHLTPISAGICLGKEQSVRIGSRYLNSVCQKIHFATKTTC